MQKHTIVFVIRRLIAGGAQNVILALARSMHIRGHQVYLICLERSESTVSSEGLTVLYFKESQNSISSLTKFIPPLHYRLLAPELDAFIRQQAGLPDMVLSNLGKSNHMLSYSRLPGVHILVHNNLSRTIQAKSNSPLVHWWLKRSYLARYMRKPCICCGEGVLSDFLKLMPMHHDVTCIVNSVDVERIRQWSQRYPCPYENFIVHIGRFSPQKRHDVLLRAYSASAIDMPLVLVGDGPLEEDIRELARQLNIEHKVIFSGLQKNPYPILAGARLLLLSSDYEGLPIVLLESMALGIPAISTDCDSGPKEILPKNNLVPVGDVQAMAKKIRHAITNPDAYQCHLPKKFHCDEAAQAYLKLIDRDIEN